MFNFAYKLKINSSLEIMKQVTAYMAFNGRLFETEEKCLAYEKKMAQYPKVKIINKKADNAYDIICHIVETWEKPSSQKKVEKYFIIGGRYKFIDMFGRYERLIMSENPFINSTETWNRSFAHFAKIILSGDELTDECVLKEVDKINESCTCKAHMLSAEIITPGRKWKIDNTQWRTGRIAPYTFTFEKKN